MNSIEDPLEQALDNGLRMTFPASDPVAVSRARELLRRGPRVDDRKARAGAIEQPQAETGDVRHPSGELSVG
jgi:hypothetical protein